MSLNVSARCGWSPNARQIRCTADCVRPTSAAIERVDQCVASLGALSKRLGDHRIDHRVGDRPRLSRPRLIDQTVQPLGLKPPPPLRDRVAMHVQALGDLAGPQPVGDQQHDPRALRERLRGRQPPRPRLQLLALSLGELDRHDRKRWHDTTIPDRTRINASRH